MARYGRELPVCITTLYRIANLVLGRPVSLAIFGIFTLIALICPVSIIIQPHKRVLILLGATKLLSSLSAARWGLVPVIKTLSVIGGLVLIACEKDLVECKSLFDDYVQKEAKSLTIAFFIGRLLLLSLTGSTMIFMGSNGNFGMLLAVLGLVCSWMVFVGYHARLFSAFLMLILATGNLIIHDFWNEKQ